jgi:hypothetical protein
MMPAVQNYKEMFANGMYNRTPIVLLFVVWKYRQM